MASVVIVQPVIFRPVIFTPVIFRPVMVAFAKREGATNVAGSVSYFIGGLLPGLSLAILADIV
jgi:hypothetical protein